MTVRPALVCRVVKAAQPDATPLAPPSATAVLLQAAPLVPSVPTALGRALPLLQTLAQNVPVITLAFRPDLSYWAHLRPFVSIPHHLT